MDRHIGVGARLHGAGHTGWHLLRERSAVLGGGFHGVVQQRRSGAQPQSVVEYWNGSSWSVQPSPNVTALSFLNSVSCVPSVGCVADGSTLTNPNGNGDPGLRAFIEQLTFPPASSQGTVLAARDGGVFAYGTAPFEGSMGGQHLNAPIVGVATTPDGQGYWLVASDGGVFAFGDAPFEGSMGGQHLNAPIVGIAPSRDGQGYWLVAATAVFSRSATPVSTVRWVAPHLNAPVVGIAATDHGGYWLVASDGGVFSFGGASFYGSAGGTRLNAPVTGVAATPDGQGYWLVGSDGGVFTYGDAAYFGSVPGQGIIGQPPVVGITSTPTGSGYWLAGANGAVYTYGDATFLGAPDAATWSPRCPQSRFVASLHLLSGTDRSGHGVRLDFEVGLHVVERQRGRFFWKPIVGDRGSEGDVFEASIASVEQGPEQHRKECCTQERTQERAWKLQAAAIRSDDPQAHHLLSEGTPGRSPAGREVGDQNDPHQALVEPMCGTETATDWEKKRPQAMLPMTYPPT